MLKELVERQKEYFSYFWQTLDLQAAERILQRFFLCEGTIVFSGVGKSGLVAKKIAMTMTSVGTKAIYVCPFNALHGDIGIIDSKDLFVMLSKSGESEELLHLIPLLRNRSVPIIAWVSNGASRLSKACDDSIVLPVEKELCPFDLAPTTSAAVQMIFGDMLAVALMRQKNFTMNEYALNHPAGRIGRRTSLRVADLMLTGARLPLCEPSHLLVDILVELSKKQCGAILVTDPSRKLLGIFTDGDLRRALQQQGAAALQSPISQLMNTTPRTICSEALAWEAMRAMESDQKHPITVLPVVSPDRNILGLIKMHDLVQSGL